jgi:hypothetical protein
MGGQSGAQSHSMQSYLSFGLTRVAPKGGRSQLHNVSTGRSDGVRKMYLSQLARSPTALLAAPGKELRTNVNSNSTNALADTCPKLVMKSLP